MRFVVPTGKFCFNGFLFIFHLVFNQHFWLPNKIFPGIGNHGVVFGIINFYFRVHVHPFFHDFQFFPKKFYQGGIKDIQVEFHTVGSNITACISGISPDHGEIIFLNPFQADRQVVFGFQRDIFLVVGSGISCWISIDPEYGEIAGMPGPHPVVGVSAEFSNGRRRCTYQADIFVSFKDKKIIFIATIKSLDTDFVFSVFSGPLLHFCSEIFDFFRPGRFFQCIRKKGNNRIGHIFHADQERSTKIFVGQFFFFRHCPESIGKIVVFGGTVVLYCTISTMVVGKQQTLVWNNFCRAKETAWSSATAGQPDNSVFKAGVVDIV